MAVMILQDFQGAVLVSEGSARDLPCLLEMFENQHSAICGRCDPGRIGS